MMQNPEIIAEALGRVKAESLGGTHIIQSHQILRADRELLLASGWLQEIIRGWYMLVRPDLASGDTATWYANFWDFIHLYLNSRFGNEYCLSAESSLDLHIENPTIPRQVVVITKHGAGLRKLIHDTSLLIYTDTKNFPQEITQKQKLNVMSLVYSLAKVAPTYFQKNPRDAELALRLIRNSDEVSRIIARYQLKAAAARFVGAYLFLKDDDMAQKIKNDLAMIGILVNPNNPFQQAEPLLTVRRLKSPYSGRIQAMWMEARDTVMSHFPKPPGLPKNKEAYLHRIDELYEYDAYNSLSIEGYHVTPELIDRVRKQKWDPSRNEYDNNMKNAMAAKGYFDAFQHVKKSIARIIRGEDAAQIVKNDLQTWYKNLFGPLVKAGILPTESLLGYRDSRVFIRNSMHSPPPQEAVLDAMESFFECIKNETHPGVNAVLGHYFFVYIHPYMDGNGRIARFLMNALLASGGYPWTVVRVENRNQYISILERTHRKFDMTEFAKFISREMASM